MINPKSVRISDRDWKKIRKNAEKNHMGINEYITECCARQRIPYKRKRQEVGRIYVELVQLCNDSPELKREIGGYVCQLRECL